MRDVGEVMQDAHLHERAWLTVAVRRSRSLPGVWFGDALRLDSDQRTHNGLERWPSHSRRPTEPHPPHEAVGIQNPGAIPSGSMPC